MNIDAVLSHYPGAIRYVRRPTQRMWIKVLKQDGSLLQYARHQTWWMQFEALKQNSAAIAYCNTQHNELCLLAVTRNPITYSLIRNPTQAVRSRAIALRPATFFSIHEPTAADWRIFLEKANNYELCLFLLRREFTDEERRRILKIHPKKITLLANRTPDDECFAVQQDPLVFVDLAHQCSEQATWCALKINPSNLFFCPRPTADMCYFVGPEGTAMRFGLVDLLMMFFQTGRVYLAALEEKGVWVQIILTVNINQ